MCASRARPSKSAGAGTKACTSVPVTTDGALVLSPCRAAAPTPPRRMAPPPLASLRGDGRASEPGRSALRLSAGCGATRGRAAPGWSPTGVAAPLPELPPEPVDMKLPYVGEAPASAPPARGCWWKTPYPAARPMLCVAGGACGRAGAGVVASKTEARGGAGGGAAEGAGPAAAARCDGTAAGGVWAASSWRRALRSLMKSRRPSAAWWVSSQQSPLSLRTVARSKHPRTCNAHGVRGGQGHQQPSRCHNTRRTHRDRISSPS